MFAYNASNNFHLLDWKVSNIIEQGFLDWFFYSDFIESYNFCIHNLISVLYRTKLILRKAAENHLIKPT